MKSYNIGETAWFITRNSTGDGWLAVQHKITRILGEDELMYYGGEDIAVPEDRLCGSAAEAFVWISKH